MAVPWKRRAEASEAPINPHCLSRAYSAETCYRAIDPVLWVGGMPDHIAVRMCGRRGWPVRGYRGHFSPISSATPPASPVCGRSRQGSPRARPTEQGHLEG